MDQLELRTRLVEKLRIEDSVIAIIELSNNSKKIELEYEYKIFSLVQEVGIENFSRLWHFFKLRNTETLREELKKKY